MSKANLAIYKYKNRKYYCKTWSRSISLEEIFQSVKKGARVTILEKDTMEDITKETLFRCLQNNFVKNQGKIPLEDIEKTIIDMNEDYGILDKVGE